MKCVAIDCYGHPLQFTGAGRSVQCSLAEADTFAEPADAEAALARAGEKGGDAIPVPSSIGIKNWAGRQAIARVWGAGGDSRLVGWQRADGSRAIETNGDPCFEDTPHFSELWEAYVEASSGVRHVAILAEDGSGAALGVGRTEAEAWAEAEEWTGSPDRVGLAAFPVSPSSAALIRAGNPDAVEIVK